MVVFKATATINGYNKNENKNKDMPPKQKKKRPLEKPNNTNRKPEMFINKANMIWYCGQAGCGRQRAATELKHT